MTTQLEQNQKYLAVCKLGWLDRLASNDQVAEKFESVGFTNVLSDGHGSDRTVTGTWSGETKEVSIPSQVVSFEKVS